MASAVQFEAVHKVFPNGVRALNNVQLRIPPGQLTTLLGPSGCGKTTLLRMVAGLEQPTTGRIQIGGVDVTDMDATQRPISMVFQSYALFPHLNVLDNVGYGLRMQNLPAQECDHHAMAALTAVGLQASATSNTSMLSGGQQQRVALARALALRPQVLLLDEPLSNLDAGLRRHIREDIRALQQSLGLTVVYVTHDHNEAMAVSDNVVVMRDGQIMQIGTPQQVYATPHCEFVAAFMGDAVMFDAEADAAGTVRLGPLRVGAGLTRRQGKVRLVVRPHAWRLEPASGTGLAGRVLSRAFLGRNTEYQVLTALGTLLVLVQGEGQPRQVDSPVSVQLDTLGVSVVMPSGAEASNDP
ncbi:iron(III) transport system ATP-binding protein [Rhodoferax ferrireducens]|uniref:Iron(III) transport system ATP-binding protein n=1 Tax=Rhodoferax ferrireducens TaxID=192843 RepID=A0ABU2CDS8_9BURK|nr:ABC transporter ATP-binding protein [Rhodoferax ferrireducens]MDR7379478.1 iron(III) transport system ATP-binding protein [Rhodoferax ferrireducens]